MVSIWVKKKNHHILEYTSHGKVRKIEERRENMQSMASGILCNLLIALQIEMGGI